VLTRRGERHWEVAVKYGILSCVADRRREVKLNDERIDASVLFKLIVIDWTKLRRVWNHSMPEPLSKGENVD
jgi:hypothetical protein